MTNEDDFEHGQFQGAGFKTAVGKKILKTRQENEFTSVNQHQEGICYMCFKKDYVTATIVDICFDCASKKGMEPIIAIVKRIPYGYCYDHGGYCKLVHPNNLAQLNIRVCEPCRKHIAKQHKELKKKGTHKVDPFWISMRKKQGKDYRTLGFNDGSMRR